MKLEDATPEWVDSLCGHRRSSSLGYYVFKVFDFVVVDGMSKKQKESVVDKMLILTGGVLKDRHTKVSDSKALRFCTDYEVRTEAYHVEGMFWYDMVSMGVVGSFMWATILFLSTIAYLNHLWDSRKKSKSKSMLAEYVKAKKDKVCPRIEWED